MTRSTSSGCRRRRSSPCWRCSACSNNRNYSDGYLFGKVGNRPSLSLGLHIHQARVLGENGDDGELEADWLRLPHYESFTMDEFMRKWTVHLAAGPGTKFRGEKELVRGAVQAVLDSAHLDEEESAGTSPRSISAASRTRCRPC